MMGMRLTLTQRCTVCGQDVGRQKDTTRVVTAPVTRLLYLVRMCRCPLCEGDVIGEVVEPGGLRQTPNDIIEKYCEYLVGSTSGGGRS